MPFRTPYGDHYHNAYGCHGATEPCSTEGLEPCTDCCCVRDGSSLSEGGPAGGMGAGTAAIMTVPPEALTGEMIAVEFGQDYEVHKGEYDAFAAALATMDDDAERARLAKGIAITTAERDFDAALRERVDLIEGEVPQDRHMPAINAIVTATATAAVLGAYSDHVGSVPTDAEWRVDPAMLAGEMADRLEESGCYPWFSETARDSVSFALPEEAHLAYDSACAMLEFRRGVMRGDIPLARAATEIGERAMSGGQSAPEGRIEIVDEPADTGIQQFDRIGVVNGELQPTSYGDGFDVGDVVYYNAGWSMILPHFALVVRRTPKMIETIDLPTVDTSTDGYGQMGHKRPVDVVDLSEERRRTKNRMNKSGTFSVDGHYTRPWDGESKDYDYMD